MDIITRIIELGDDTIHSIFVLWRHHAFDIFGEEEEGLFIFEDTDVFVEELPSVVGDAS
jgi:hypothetical protein